MASVPLAPKPLPLAGHTLSLLRTPLAFLNSLPETGDLVEVRFGTVQVYFACTPELARQVIMDERTFDKGGPFYKRTREIFGNGLGTCPHAEHRRQRRLIQPAFTSARYGHYAKVMTERIGEVVGGWREGQSLDLFPEMQRITAFTVMTTMIGPQALGPDIMPRVIEDMNTVVKGMYFRMFLPSALDRVPLPSNRRHERAMARLRSDLGAAIARYRSVEDDQQDLMSILVRAQDEESAEDGRTRLTEEELVSQVETIFVAGADSTAGIIAWALHLIASRPGIEAALQQEADEVLVDGAAGFEDLPRLKVAGRVITETLRLYPPGWLLTRTVTRDTRLGEYDLKAGSMVAFSPYLIHHRADLHPDPESFDPDRWAGTTPARAPVNGSMIPFGGGGRKCIGDTFATSQAILALAMVAARWSLRDAPGARPRPSLSGLLVPKGIRMIPSARQACRT